MFAAAGMPYADLLDELVQGANAAMSTMVRLRRMTPLPDAWQRGRPWVPDVVAGLVVALLGLWEVHDDLTVTSRFGEVLVVLGVAVGRLARASRARHRPGRGLADRRRPRRHRHRSDGDRGRLRRGRLRLRPLGQHRRGLAQRGLDPARRLRSRSRCSTRTCSTTRSGRPASRSSPSRAYDGTNGWRVPAALLGTALLMAPWLLGLALRFSARSQESRALAGRGRGRARPGRGDRPAPRGPGPARPRRARRRRPLAGGDPGPGRVRAVPRRRRHRRPQAHHDEHRDLGPGLAGRRPAGAGLDPGAAVADAGGQPDLESLLDGVRASGHVVESTVVGTPQPMPPELEVVAFRVLQEMLTNAIKHGRRDRPVLVERHWDDDLRIEVQNAVPDGPVRGPARRGARGSGIAGCAAGSRRSAAGSTYAGAPTRPPSPRRRGYPSGCWRERDRSDPRAPGRRPGAVPRGRAGDRRRPGRARGRRRPPATASRRSGSSTSSPPTSC